MHVRRWVGVAHGKKHESLGGNVIPLNYNIFIDTDFKRFRYSGRERIRVRVARPTSSILLNSKEIEVKGASVRCRGRDHKAMVSHITKRQHIRLSLDRKVSGECTIDIDFVGTNNDKMYGFYRSRYKYNSTQGYLLTTQFEPVDARAAFPCFDEPALKATFDLTLVVDKEFSAISNMPAISETVEGRRKRVVFGTTPRMACYTFYMGVGRFDIKKIRAGARQIRGIGAPGRGPSLSLSMAYGRRFLHFYERYFRIRYPLPKLDLIAIPDFSVGAMENWGAITFRESDMLGDEKTAFIFRRRIALVVSHEISHQWFGNLVTMKWWDDLWLNESFARFMESRSIDHVFPSWKFGMYDTVSSGAMGADALRSTHPIYVMASSAVEINNMLDPAITYDKGSSVLKMLEDYVGRETFRNGLNIYLKRHMYSNASKEDLWNAIRDADGKSGSDVPRVARAWIEQAGYPIVEADGPRNGIVRLRQRRFRTLPEGRDRETWPIPIRYMTNKGEGVFLMRSREQTLRVKGADFIKLNHGQRGFYRVSYSKDNLEQLGRLILEGEMDPFDAWGIENDLAAISRAGGLKADTFIDFIESYCMDARYPLNVAVSAHLSGLLALFSDNKRLSARIEKLALRFNRNVLKSVGWQKRGSESEFTAMIRMAAIRALGELGDREVLRRANEMFLRFVRGGARIESNMRTAVYAIVAAHGNAALLERFMKMYSASDADSEELSNIRAALGNFRDKRLLARALDFSMGDAVRLQDKPIIAIYASRNPAARGLMLGWTKRNWKELSRMYKGTFALLDKYIGCLSILSSEADLGEVRRFFMEKGNRVESVQKELRNTLERIESNVRYLRANR